MYQEQRKMILLNSVTYAYKARDYLFKKGIRGYVERIPANLRTTGCGYGVRVTQNAEAIAQILTEAGFSVRGILQL